MIDEATDEGKLTGGRAKKTIPARRRAYSYIRFSTPEQAEGDSERRQIKLTREYCDENKLILDEQLRDRGISAYSGANRVVGAFKGFLQRVETGQIPAGSVLIVESLDRLSRQAAFKAQAGLLNLLAAGITVVTLVDKHSYSEESVTANPGLLFYALSVCMRAHDESKTKAVRINETWDEKRKLIAAGTPVRQVLPAWLRWQGKKGETSIVAIPERAEVIRKIFTWRADGWSKRRIVEGVNKITKPWGPRRDIEKRKTRVRPGWHTSYVTKLLRNRAIIGEFVPHKFLNGKGSKRIPMGKAVVGYYPAIVQPSLFALANQKEKTRIEPRGRTGAENLFTGLAYDGHNGAPMQLERKGDGCNYLTTARDWRHANPDKVPARWKLERFEEALLKFLGEINWSAILIDEDSDKQADLIRGMREQLAVIKDEQAALQEKLENAAKVLVSGAVGILARQIEEQSRELDAAHKQLGERRSEIEARIAQQDEAARTAKEGSTEIEALVANRNDADVRKRLRDEIHKLVQRIDVFPDGSVPGEDDEHLQNEAALLLTGNRGIVAKQTGRLVGAFRATFVSGKTCTAWVTYRPAARAKEEIIILQLTGGPEYSPAEWRKQTTIRGMGDVDVPDAEALLAKARAAGNPEAQPATEEEIAEALKMFPPPKKKKPRTSSARETKTTPR